MTTSSPPIGFYPSRARGPDVQNAIRIRRAWPETACPSRARGDKNSWLRFHIPLIEPDWRIARIRLSDKTSRLHPRRATTELGQAYEAEMLVKVREWIAPPLRRQTLCLKRNHRRNRIAV